MANQSEHDWMQYRESPGRDRSGWLVVREPDEHAPAVEAYVTMDSNHPVVVQLVCYGPRGGVHVHATGTVEGIRNQIARLMQLKEIAQHLEEVRPR